MSTFDASQPPQPSDFPHVPPASPPLEPPRTTSLPPIPPQPPWPTTSAPPPPPGGGPQRPAQGSTSRKLTGALLTVAMLLAGGAGVAIGANLHHSSASSAAPTAVTQTPTTTPPRAQALPTPQTTPSTTPSPSTTGPSTTSPSTTPTPSTNPNRRGGTGSGSGGSSGSSGSSGADSAAAAQIANTVDPSVVDIYDTLTNGEAAGTGMVLTSDGLVLTNNHVIADSTDIRVQVNGSGPSYKADVLGYDATDDVALLQLEGASGLQPVSVGDSTTLKVNDAVVALGNALGQGGSPAVAAGTITGLDQTITVSDETGQNAEQLSGLIEVNAALQPGDSGGPLVNQSAQVIGMDTAASASFRRTAADGYAIPINDALAIARQIQAGKASANVHIGDRALLGVDIQDSGGAAVVAAVEPSSPADDAGLAAGDTIVAVDGNQISDGASLRSALDAYHPGDHITVSWTDSNGQSHQAQATLVKGPPA